MSRVIRLLVLLGTVAGAVLIMAAIALINIVNQGSRSSDEREHLNHLVYIDRGSTLTRASKILSESDRIRLREELFLPALMSDESTKHERSLSERELIGIKAALLLFTAKDSLLEERLMTALNRYFEHAPMTIGDVESAALTYIWIAAEIDSSRVIKFLSELRDQVQESKAIHEALAVVKLISWDEYNDAENEAALHLSQDKFRRLAWLIRFSRALEANGYSGLIRNGEINKDLLVKVIEEYCEKSKLAEVYYFRLNERFWLAASASQVLVETSGKALSRTLFPPGIRCNDPISFSKEFNPKGWREYLETKAKSRARRVNDNGANTNSKS